MIDGIICQKGELNAGKMSEDFFHHFFIALHQFFLPIIVGIHVIGADIKENPGGSECIDAGFHMFQHFCCGETADAAIIDQRRKTGAQLKFVDGKLLHQAGSGKKDLTGNHGSVQIIITDKFQCFFRI